MIHHLRANLWLVVLSLVICCVLYPLALLAIGQFAFPASAEGSLVLDSHGQAIGSRLIAQPFTSDRYFQPRPSAASYNAAASGASNLGASNCQLRDRVAQALGPIAKYSAGAKTGQLVGADIEAWFAKNPDVVGRWAAAHPTAAQNWVKNGDKSLTDYIAAWQKSHPKDVADWVNDNPATPEPQPSDIAVAFFKSFASEHPGKFPSAVDHPAADGKSEKRIDLVSDGGDVQSVFFDMWLQDNRDVKLKSVPGDLVTQSGSGLDPDITLDNADYQLDRVAGDWAKRLKREEPGVRKEINAILQERAVAPLGGAVGVKLVNVLETNLALNAHFEPALQSK